MYPELWSHAIFKDAPKRLVINQEILTLKMTIPDKMILNEYFSLFADLKIASISEYK